MTRTRRHGVRVRRRRTRRNSARVSFYRGMERGGAKYDTGDRLIRLLVFRRRRDTAGLWSLGGRAWFGSGVLVVSSFCRLEGESDLV